MQQKIFTIVCLVFFISTATAQKTFKWTGFYVGVNAGFESGKTEFSGFNQIIYQITNVNPPGPQPLTVVPATSRDIPPVTDKKTSFVGGIHFGYNKQHNNLIYGAEFNIFKPGIEGSQNTRDSLPPTLLSGASPYNIHRDASMEYAFSVTPKIGYAFDHSFVYAMAGPVFANTEVAASDTFTSKCCSPGQTTPNYPPAVYTFPASDIRNVEDKKFAVGLSLGIGYENLISDKLSLGVSYRHSMVKGDYQIKSNGPRNFDINTGQIDPNGSLAQYLESSTHSVKFTQDQFTARLSLFLNRNSTKKEK